MENLITPGSVASPAQPNNTALKSKSDATQHTSKAYPVKNILFIFVYIVALFYIIEFFAQLQIE